MCAGGSACRCCIYYYYPAVTLVVFTITTVQATGLNRELSEKKTKLVADMELFETEQVAMREAVDQAVGAVEATKQQLQNAARAKLANAIVGLENELMSSRERVSACVVRGNDAGATGPDCRGERGIVEAARGGRESS